MDGFKNARAKRAREKLLAGSSEKEDTVVDSDDDNIDQETEVEIKNAPVDTEAPKAKEVFTPPPKVDLTPPKKQRFQAIRNVITKLKKLPRKWVLVGVGVVLIGATAGFIYWPRAEVAEEVAIQLPETPEVDDTPQLVASTLSGRMVEEALTKRPVTGIMIENSLASRPQSGLPEAGIVFEAIAEAGITRLLAIYQETTPESIGPIRSARPPFVRWLAAFDASYGHVGGSGEGLQQVAQHIDKDIDQFSNGKYYQRVSNKSAPHNVYTGFSSLDALNAAKGYTSSEFTGFLRKEASPSEAPTASTISMTISGFYFDPNYTYDKTSNRYLRSIAGQPHMDEATNTQLAPDVVIAIKVPGRSYNAPDGSARHDYTTEGSGQAWVFQDGTITEGTWKKTAVKTQIEFLDSAGEAIALNPGLTWITAVSGTTWQ